MCFMLDDNQGIGCEPKLDEDNESKQYVFVEFQMKLKKKPAECRLFFMNTCYFWGCLSSATHRMMPRTARPAVG